jgi:hypothetical protein
MAPLPVDLRIPGKVSGASGGSAVISETNSAFDRLERMLNWRWLPIVEDVSCDMRPHISRRREPDKLQQRRRAAGASGANCRTSWKPLTAE